MGWQRSFTLTLEDMGNRTLSCLTWSPNGKMLAVGYTDGAIQLFGVETGASTSQHHWVYSSLQEDVGIHRVSLTNNVVAAYWC